MGHTDRYHNKIDVVFITVAERVFQPVFTSAALIEVTVWRFGIRLMTLCV